MNEMRMICLLLIATLAGCRGASEGASEGASKGAFDPACAENIVSDSTPNGMRRADFVYGPVAHELIARGQFKVLSARKDPAIPNVCIATVAIDGTVDGDSYKGVVELLAF